MSFSITAPPNTDVWRKPPKHIAYNAPQHPAKPTHHPLSTFKSARVSLALPPAAKLTQYDQGGLLLQLTKADAKDKWLKTGVEFYEGAPYVSTVGCDAWADWSVMPLSAVSPAGQGKVEATVEVVREGMGLWVYAVHGDKKIPLREVTWFFAEEEGWNVSAAAYAARPGEGNEGESGLVVEFQGLDVVNA